MHELSSGARLLDAVIRSITLTKAEALAIQAQQVEHYAAIYGPQVRQQVADATTADQLEDDVAYDMATINRHIPRGGFIEALMPEKMKAERDAQPPVFVEVLSKPRGA